MTVHLIRMAAGLDSIAGLAARQARLRAIGDDGSPVVRVRTRNVPKRAAEVLDGGSLYWIIKGFARARQPVLDIGHVMDSEGRKRCIITLDPEIVPTELQPRRPQQGWRYLDPSEAPRDRLGEDAAGGLPEEMAAELRELGLL